MMKKHGYTPDEHKAKIESMSGDNSGGANDVLCCKIASNRSDKTASEIIEAVNSGMAVIAVCLEDATNVTKGQVFTLMSAPNVYNVKFAAVCRYYDSSTQKTTARLVQLKIDSNGYISTEPILTFG